RATLGGFTAHAIDAHDFADDLVGLIFSSDGDRRRRRRQYLAHDLAFALDAIFVDDADLENIFSGFRRDEIGLADPFSVFKSSSGWVFDCDRRTFQLLPAETELRGAIGIGADQQLNTAVVAGLFGIRC